MYKNYFTVVEDSFNHERVNKNSISGPDREKTRMNKIE